MSLEANHERAGAQSSRSRRMIFVTGASGYIGGRLVPLLLDAGYRVRCLADHPRVEIVAGDVEDRDLLAELMQGCEVAYYLVHSMLAAGAEYAAHDRELASSFAAAAERADCRRIIYLGGLGETGAGLSEHLASRREVEEALASGSVPVTVLRAGMIIGSGSASFEILRYLVERLPIMITPRWVRTESQPIAVRNVLDYLLAVLDAPETTGRTLDIGGPEILSYLELMRIMAEALKLPRRWVLPVPVLTPRLSSLWIHLGRRNDLRARGEIRSEGHAGAGLPRRLPHRRAQRVVCRRPPVAGARGDRPTARRTGTQARPSQRGEHQLR